MPEVKRGRVVLVHRSEQRLHVPSACALLRLVSKFEPLKGNCGEPGWRLSTPNSELSGNLFYGREADAPPIAQLRAPSFLSSSFNWQRMVCQSMSRPIDGMIGAFVQRQGLVGKIDLDDGIVV